MVKEHKKHGRRVLCIFTAAVIAAVSMLCFAGCGSKSTEEKTVSGIITAIADGKYTLQPGTIESTENQFPGGMNDLSLIQSDAADERSSVDLGGCRIIKKKKKKKITRSYCAATSAISNRI